MRFGIKGGLSRTLHRCLCSTQPEPFRFATRFPNAEFLPIPTKLIKNMKNLTKEKSITELNCGERKISVVNLDIKIAKDSLSSDLLFVRDFYPDLLTNIRTKSKSILIGNPGISKSFFHYYYLLRIFNPSLFGPLTQDFYSLQAKSSDVIVPEIVVRQICDEEIQVYDIKNETVYKVDDTKDIFNCLSANNYDEKSLYLIEPGARVKIGPYTTNIPTLTTVSPDTSRYKEFQKSGGIFFYMPCYTQQELLAIGNYLRGNVNANPPIPSRLNPGLDDYYKEKSIKQRFYQFGGIIRHVLPSRIGYLDDTQQIQKEVIEVTSSTDQAVRILSSNTLDNKPTSHFIAQYVIPTDGKKMLFRKPTLQVISQYVRDKLFQAICKFSLEDNIRILRSNDETNGFKDVTPKIFENYLSKILTGKGITCHQQELKLYKQTDIPKGKKNTINEKYKANPNNWKSYELKLSPTIKDFSLSYTNMKYDTLYYLTVVTHPFCEFFYKDEKGNLCVFQLTQQKKGLKYIKPFTFSKFLKSINFPENLISTHFKLIFVPGPKQAESISLVVQKPSVKEKDDQKNLKEVKTLDLIENYTIWKLPDHYDL